MTLIPSLKTAALIASVALAGITYAHAETGPTQLVDDLNGVFGKHAGARAVHAKGVVLEGTFTPAASAKSISKAIHLQSTSVPITVRFSSFAGIPDISDNHGLASPRGLAIKFHLPDGSETDIVAHSFNGFPSATANDFHELLQALGSSGPDAPKPTNLDNYLGSHPAAKAFLTALKPAPESFGTLPYYGVNTFKFTNAKSATAFGRYQFLPVAGNKYLTEEETKNAAPNYLEDEIKTRIKNGPVKFKLVVELAEKGDKIDDPSITWPNNRRKIELGTIEINQPVIDSGEAEKQLVFMPNRLPEGVAVEDPMINARSNSYAVSYSRRSQ